jgi:hypothetical protein
MLFLTQGKTNRKYILIVVILAIIVGGGILWCYLRFQEIKFPPIKLEKKVTITTDKTEYDTNETVKITVKNNLDKSIWYASSPYVRNLELLGYDEKTNWGLVPLLPPSPPPEGWPFEIKELKKNEVLTLEYRSLDWHHPVAINFLKYKLSFEYRENKEEGEYITIYSNEFTIKEKGVTDQCSPIDFAGYELAKNYEFNIDLNNDGEKEIVRVYWDSKEACDKVKPIMVKVFSGTENCPKEVFSSGWGNQVGKAEIFQNFWGDGSDVVLVEGMSYACGCGSTIRLLFFTYREGKYSVVEGPEIGGLSLLYMFTGWNGLGKRIIVAREKWDSDYSDYCCGCSSKRQFMLYTWNGEGYTEVKGGITQNKYPPSESIEDIIQKENQQ